MKLKVSILAGLLAAGTLLSAIPNHAGAVDGIGQMKTLGLEQSMVDQAHFWHRTCQRGLNGWHKHVKGIGRVQCTNHICKHGKCHWF